MLKRFKINIKEEYGFMGLTHSLSALALFLLATALMPNLIFLYLGTEDLFVYLCSIFVLIGASIGPDFDNSKSTAISSLGIVGRGISTLLRTIAVFIYSITRSKKDNPEPNPHRGFWHTILSTILLYFLILSVISIPTKVNINNNVYSIGFIMFFILLFGCIHLAIASLFGTFTKALKRKGNIGTIISLIISLIITLFFIFVLPKNTNYKWFPFMFSMGWLIHILGDTLTISGTPLLFPLKINGKRWWTIRLTPIHANGTIEKCLIIPIFLLIIILSLFKIIYNLSF